jgi:hypothetical protein
MSEAKISNAEASRLLTAVTPDKAFHFYSGIGQPLGRSSRSMMEFADTVKDIDPSSVKFHLERGDFESWFKMLGDPVLAGKFSTLRGKNLSAKELRSKVSSRVGARISQLQKAKRITVSPKGSRS